MAVMIPFTSNYTDHSTEFGFQFEFHCQRCGNGYMSTFQKSAMGTGGGLLRAAGSIFGGALSSAGYAGSSLADLTRGPAHDGALTKAVEEMRPYFKQCHRCGEWVCNEICWNDKTGLCTRCSPKLQQEIAAAQSEAQINQVREKVSQVDFTGGLDLKSRTPAICPSCQQETQGGKFCSNCGAPLATKKFCSNCGNEVKAGTRFCPECGQKQG
jgi:RNA polymerase subunit RPABC4/transcription elongation factor Spt4